MAERIIKTTLQLDGADKFNRNIKAVNSELSVLKSEFKALSAAYESGDKSIQNVSAMYQNLQSQVEIQKSKVEALKGAVQSSNGTYEQAKSRLEEAKRKYNEVAEAQGKNSDEAKKAAEEVQKASLAVDRAGNNYDKYRRQLANAQTALTSSTSALQDFVRSQRNADIEIEQSEETIQQTGETIQETTQNTNQFREALKKIGDVKVEDISSRFDKIKESARKATESVAKITFKAAETSAQAYFKTTETGFKSGLTAVETYAKALGTVVTAVGMLSGKTSMDFESQMSVVQSISGASAEEYEKLSEKALEMGRTTSFSASQSAKALEYMAMAGWDVDDMADGLSGIVRLAESSGEELATVSDIVTDAMTAFGMTADMSDHFADVLAKTASSANANVGMMGETFKYVAPLAGALNYSIEDMSVAIGLMANAGIKGSNSGTALRTLISNLADPTDEVATAMEELGISLTNDDGTMKSFKETLASFRNGFAGLTEVQKAQYASTLAGQRGMSGLLAMVNASDEDFDKLRESIDNCTDAAEKMAEIRIDNLQGDITLLKSSLEGIGIAIGQSFSPMLRKAVQSVKEIADSFNENGFESAIGKFQKVSAQALDFASSEIPKKLPKIISIFNTVATQIARTAVKFMPVIRKTVLPEILKGTKELALSAVDLLPEFSTELTGSAIELFGGIFDGLNSVMDRLMPAIPETVKTIINKFKENAPKLFNQTLDFFGNVTQAFTEIAGQILPEIPNLINSVVAEFKSDENKERFSGIFDKLDIVGNFNSILQNTDFGTIAETVSSGITSAINGLENFFANIDYESLAQDITDFANGIDWNGILGATAKTIGTIIKNTPSLAKDIFSGLDVEVQTAIIGATIAKSIVSSLLTTFKTSDTISAGFASVKAVMTTNLSAIGTAGGASLTTALGGAVTGFLVGWNIGTLIREAIGPEKIDEALEPFFDAWTSGWNDIYNFYAGVIDKIIDKWHELQNLFSTMSFKGFGDYFYNEWLLGEDVPMFAKGGFLQSGKAIVGEQGPELIELKNGGVQVTPFSDFQNIGNSLLSGLSAVERVSNSSVTNNDNRSFYMTVNLNATLQSDSDIDRTAELLARRTQKILAGQGM